MSASGQKAANSVGIANERSRPDVCDMPRRGGDRSVSSIRISERLLTRIGHGRRRVAGSVGPCGMTPRCDRRRSRHGSNQTAARRDGWRRAQAGLPSRRPARSPRRGCRGPARRARRRRLHTARVRAPGRGVAGCTRVPLRQRSWAPLDHRQDGVRRTVRRDGEGAVGCGAPTGTSLAGDRGGLRRLRAASPRAVQGDLRLGGPGGWARGSAEDVGTPCLRDPRHEVLRTEAADLDVSTVFVWSLMHGLAMLLPDGRLSMVLDEGDEGRGRRALVAKVAALLVSR